METEGKSRNRLPKCYMELKACSTINTKSKKDIWKEQVLKLKECELCVKSIAEIIGVSTSVIYRDLKNKTFVGPTKKGIGQKSDWAFTHHDVIAYIDDFEDNIMEIKEPQILPSKKIPFPGWQWDK